ncbi:MAG: efflux RND transporter periplasmic adaptor subunit [Planctomycetes bacterium]|nr:efflux RND transporter periplasmic adaptor subunit [Planctomycetota bacterium]
MFKSVLSTGAVFAALMALFVYAANDWKLPWAEPHPLDIPWCEPHDVALENCETCNPKLARGGTRVSRLREPAEGECPNTVLRIDLAEGAAERLGLRFYEVRPREVQETLEANAETRWPPDKYARVAPRIAGVVREVKAVIGRTVSAGDVLALLDSPAFGVAKSDYLQALSVLSLRQKTYDTEKALAPRITTARQMMEAETAFEEAKLAVQGAEQKLAALGLSAQEIGRLREKRDASPELEVRAPFGGIVVEASAVPGETAGPDRPIFSVADAERLWLSIDVYERDLPRIRIDQKVFFHVEGLPGRKFPGRVAAVGSEIDNRSRTAKAYADVKNVQGLLRANMFGRAEIRIREPEAKILVPQEAVQNDGDCLIVFVSPSKDTFLPRKIEVGTVYANGYEVLGGLAAGENIVTTGSFQLKTEILRGQIGAG